VIFTKKGAKVIAGCDNRYNNIASNKIIKSPGIFFIMEKPSLISLIKEFISLLTWIFGALSVIRGYNAIKKVITSIHKINFIGKKINSVAATAGPIRFTIPSNMNLILFILLNFSLGIIDGKIALTVGI